MALITQKPKGTEDILPKDSFKWKTVENILGEIATKYGYKEIRTPVFEHTELFQRSVGETTDVVQKEMYTFNDKGDRSITLRPEGTAGAARAMLQHALYNEGLPVKVFYQTTCYRYENVQKGRLREFHQFGAELYGSESPLADIETIALANSIFTYFDMKNIELEINSIGCKTCRANFQKALQEYFESSKESLCKTCLDRLDRNPMRILDCKSPVCSEIAQGAPKILDYLCDDCNKHFTTVKEGLTALNIPFTVNPTIVRGLDYYNRTVFEFVTTKLGAQGTVLGGGRYDGLMEELGGTHTPSLGFAMGMERFLGLLEANEITLPEEPTCDLYICALGEKAQIEALKLVQSVREEGFYGECDVVSRKLKGQMKYADKIKAKYSLVIGDSEIETGVAKLKDMATGAQEEIKLSEIIVKLYDKSFDQTLSAMGESDMFDSIENIGDLLK